MCYGKILTNIKPLCLLSKANQRKRHTRIGQDAGGITGTVQRSEELIRS